MSSFNQSRGARKAHQAHFRHRETWMPKLQEASFKSKNHSFFLRAKTALVRHLSAPAAPPPKMPQKVC
jgi:hypothetical protein